MLAELKERLPEYEIKPITKANCADVMEVYTANQAYFLLTNGQAAGIKDCLSDITEVPPGFDPANKLFLGMWRSGRCIGVLDALDGFPDADCVWIGLLLVHGDLHRQRIGATIACAVLGAAKKTGHVRVQLGVVDSNTKALTFWKKLGFEKLREAKVRQEGRPEWSVIVMERPAD